MSDYQTRYTEAEKRQKISKFNSIYYNGDSNNWKVSRLPNWMSFYGWALEKEIDNRLPQYYRKFKQGTIVMFNYGVTVGSELGGKHFGIVLNNDDTKYKKKVTVVPLSSHKHKGYIDLGYDLMSGIINLLDERKDEEVAKIDKMTARLTEFRKSHSEKNFSFTDDEIDFINKNKIKDFPDSDAEINFNIMTSNKKLEKLINNIKDVNSWETYKNIFNFVSFVETALTFQKRVKRDLKELNSNLNQMKNLASKLHKYNKQSFAVISDIKSVSKLRVEKLTHFTISGNTRISENTFNKIKLGLIKTIE